MTLDYRILVVDAGTGRVTERGLRNVMGAIDAGLRVHEEAQSWEKPPLSQGNPLFLGIGPLVLGPFFGAHRLVAVFRSPVTWGIHVSTMGGAGIDLARTSVDGVVVTGHSRDPAVVFIVDKGSGAEAWVEYLDQGELWRAYSRGTRGLHEYILDRMDESVRKLKPRIILAGPAAWNTVFAGLFSWVPLPDGRPSPVVDSASRGGAGSVLARAHGVAAIVVGGRNGKARYDRRRALGLAKKVLGADYYKALEAATTKYRYDPRLGTGGTFGVNYVHYRELIPALAYNTIYYSRPVRLAVHEKIMKWFWRPFQERVFILEGARAWRNCGEPCNVVCKKIWNGVKLDYEPAHGLGPMIGVVTLEDTAELVALADDLGIDAIEAGHVIAWIFDAVEKGLLDHKELDLPARPSLDPLALGPETSKANAAAAKTILERLATRRGEHEALIGAEGSRKAARLLDELYDSRVSRTRVRFRDLLVYAAFGRQGYMTPNYYWSPGMVAPLYILGRYWTSYSPTFASPEEYARHSLSRAYAELAIDNAGMCRFHRKWAEKLLPHIYRELLGVDRDPYDAARKIYSRIAIYQIRAGAEPQPWESRKTMDLVATIAAEIGVRGWEDALGDYDRILEWWNAFYQIVRDSIMI